MTFLLLSSSTLGDVSVFAFATLRSGLVMIDFTLIAGLSSIAFSVGIISVRFSNLTISKIELFSSSPAYSDRIPNFGGLAKMDRMSEAACWMKSDSLNKENYIIVGKNSTVSEFTSDFILGM